MDSGLKILMEMMFIHLYQNLIVEKKIFDILEYVTARLHQIQKLYIWWIKMVRDELLENVVDWKSNKANGSRQKKMQH